MSNNFEKDPFCRIAVYNSNPADLAETIRALAGCGDCVLLSEDIILESIGLLELVKSLDLTYLHGPAQFMEAQDILNALASIPTENPFFLAIGGGSIMDLCKGIIYLLPAYKKGGIKKVDDIYEIAKNQSEYEENIEAEWIAVPSTSGTGSEMTCWATLWDIANQKKYSLKDQQLYAKESILIPEATLSLPLEQTLVTGLDALTQAFEAFWARKSNFVVKAIASQAIKEILVVLPKLVRDLGNIELRRKMQEASALTGIAFSNTATTACHSISYPLTSEFKIPHGYAVALTLAVIANRNRNVDQELDQFLCELFPENRNGLQNWLDELTKNIQVLRLKAFNVPEEELEQVVDNAVTPGRMDNNPILFTKDEIRQILAEVYI